MPCPSHPPWLHHSFNSMTHKLNVFIMLFGDYLPRTTSYICETSSHIRTCEHGSEGCQEYKQLCEHQIDHCSRAVWYG
jgi:hypothetical protein